MIPVIAIVGMAGAGKTRAATFFSEKGYEVFRFGSVIDDGLKEEELPWTAENNKYYREKIRKELGMAAVAIKMLPKIKEALLQNKKIVLDGLYSWEEYVFLKKEVPELFLLCIYASPKIRYERLVVRKERTFTEEEARQRDVSELSLNKGGPIAIADYLIKNETTGEEFQSELEKFSSTYSS
ncbi:MAG TPA: AAA family ATPase [Patescibacteria group bacterium]|nr:AAA family ATPase [Patescibacteria group bacterium]